MQKRGQAAMEFLMTYGWAILAVIISIAALAYFGVLSPSLFLPESCTLFPGVACKDIDVGRNAVVVTLQNGIGSNINGLRLSIPGLVNCYSRTINLADGEQKNLAINGSGCNFLGKSLRSDVNVEYDTGGLKHTRIGKLAGGIHSGNIVAYYSFDDGTAKDLSGFGNDGIFPGGAANPTYVPSGCVSGGCFSFDGVDDYFNMGKGASLNSAEFSVEMQVKPITIHAGCCPQNNMLMSRENYLISGFRLGFNPSGNVAFWSSESIPSGGFYSQSSTSITTSRFYNILAIYKSGTANLYIDGVNVGTATGSYIQPVGRDLLLNWPTGVQSSNSYIDEVKIYNYAIR